MVEIFEKANPKKEAIGCLNISVIILIPKKYCIIVLTTKVINAPKVPIAIDLRIIFLVNTFLNFISLNFFKALNIFILLCSGTVLFKLSLLKLKFKGFILINKVKTISKNIFVSNAFKEGVNIYTIDPINIYKA